MRLPLTRNEKLMSAFCAGLLALAVFGPATAQLAHQHDFADQRVLWGIAFAMDVLSNLPFAIAGLLGLAVAGRVSERAGALTGLAVLVLGPLSVQLWSVTGNVLPWACVQFGGMALVVWLACLRGRPGAIDVRWIWVIAAYAAAKLLEMNDHAIFDATGQLVSGHTLKHAVAAMAALPVIAALWHARESGQNAFA